MSLKVDSSVLAPIQTAKSEPTAEAARPKRQENPAARKVAQQYEALFVNQLVSAMRKTVTKGGLVPESHAERVYQGMLDSEYSQKMAETNQLGLSNMVYDHLMKGR